MSSALSSPHFHDEAKAFEFVEARVWPEGPVCPHCGGVDRVGRLKGKTTRPGLWKCYQCRKPFTVRIGTIFESSKIPLHVWLQALYLMAGSKKGISSNQLHRTLGVTLKTAWFMSHRIREAMREGEFEPMGGGGAMVEVDETFIGRRKGTEVRQAYHHKMAVLSLVDRSTGKARSMVVENVGPSTIIPLVKANLDRETHLITDEGTAYRYAKHHFVDHSHVSHRRAEYVRGEVHTNTIEGFFSIFKRGMRGVYQFCSEKHLHRYLAEFDFRYSNREAVGVDDRARAEMLLKGVVGKRLTYHQSCARN